MGRADHGLVELDAPQEQDNLQPIALALPMPSAA
jgi:hypothetical protein